MNPNLIELEVLEVAPGTVCVLPLPHRIQAARDLTIKQIEADSSLDDQQRLTRTEAADEMMRKSQELYEKLRPKARLRGYAFHPYTAEDKLQAQAEATHYVDIQPVFNPTKYQASLFRRCFKATPLSTIEPPIYEALIAEMMERTEPDPSRLDFLFSWRRTLETTG